MKNSARIRLAEWKCYLRNLVLVCVAAQLLPTASFGQTLGDEVQSIALANIHRATCGGAGLCSKATTDEIANPPLSDELMERIVETSALSLTAERCGLNFAQKVFHPFMSDLRKSGAHSVREMAIVGMSHGIGMGLFEKQVPTDCTDAMKELLKQRGIL